MTVEPGLRQQIETEIMARGDVTQRNMMGTTAYMVRNRMFAFWVADGLVAKLPDRARQEFLDRKQAMLFQGPQGRGFGEWTRLHLDKNDDVATVAAGVKQAYDYVKGGTRGVARAAAARKKSPGRPEHKKGRRK